MTDTPEQQRAVPEAVEGGSGGAGAGKVTFNPWSITR